MSTASAPSTARADEQQPDRPARTSPAVTSPLLEAARAIAPQVVADRRAIHRHPELAYQEHRTAAFVAERLTELGIEVRTGVAGTGVIGLLRGARPGKTVLLRADMDALPIQEEANEENADYVSQSPGVMHACGHDAHTAILLGAARLLAERRDRIAGTVTLMFQPAEENGGAGAKRMIDEGVLDDPKVDAAFGLHVGRTEIGQIALRAGSINGSSDRFVITVRGRGGHASRPQQAVDPIVVGAYIITALQTLISREISPADQGVITVGSLASGSIFNVIPDTAVLKGTFRASTPAVRDHLRTRIPEIAQGIAAAMRATAEYEEYGIGYPVMVCDPTMVELARGAVSDIIGPAGVVEAERTMGGEDFAFVLERVPGAFLGLGVRSPSWQEPRSAHSPRFNLDENALPFGVAAMAGVALRFLGDA